MKSVAPILFILWHGSPLPPHLETYHPIIPPPEEIVPCVCPLPPGPTPCTCPANNPGSALNPDAVLPTLDAIMRTQHARIHA